MERMIRATLPSGHELEWEPAHRPVSMQRAENLSMTWEDEDGSVFSVSINTQNIAALEMVTTRDEQDQEILDLIERAKALDATEKEED